MSPDRTWASWQGWLALAAAAALAGLGGSGCTSGEAEAASPVSAAAPASAAAGTPASAAAIAELDEEAAARAFARKRAGLLRQLAGTVEEIEEQIEMIDDTIAGRESNRDPDDEDERVSAIFVRMADSRAALAAHERAVDDALARLAAASVRDWPRISWASRMAVDELEVATEATAASLYH